jgi:hypothetical protein
MSSKLTTKILSAVISVATVVWLSGSIIATPTAHAATIDELLQQIAALQAQLLALQGGSSSTAASCTFTRALTVGSTGADVTCLQNYLKSTGNMAASQTATGYFGAITKAAVAKWQAANGVSPAAGYFGPVSQAKYATLVTSTPSTPTVPTTPSTGTGLMVSLASDQPVPGLFGENFASRPFTKLVFTAGMDGDVTVKSLRIQRTGQGQDAAFNGVVALDEDGIRLGDAKTFGSDHTLSLPNSFVVKAGQSRTVTLAGDSDSDQNDYNGQLVSLTLNSVDAGTGVTVNGIGSSGLTGTTHTINSTLSIGSVTLERGSFDPGTGATKEVGTTGYTFSALKLTAGSNEDVVVKSVTFNQSGSAGSNDLANVKVNIGGTDYPTTLSADGKYYTAKFGTGITINKGLNKEVVIKGDIVSGSNRGVDFDLYRVADVKVMGATYGYDILPTYTNSSDSATDDDGTLQSSNPNYDAYEVTIGAGTMGIETASSEVPAQNVAINLPDQPLGGFKITVKGEPISVAQTVFRLSRWNGTNAANSTQDITNITLVDPTGKVVAGPVDIAASSPTVTFTDTITYPVGTAMVYTLKGKLGTDFANDNTIAASTTPNSDWTTVKGQNTNQTVTLSSATFTSNTMTVKSGALRVATSPTPIAQTIVAGVNGFNFANFSLDATASGEDIRLNSIQVEYNFGQASSNDDLTNCQLFDGATPLNTGSNVVNPLNADTTADDKTFTFDSSLVIPKGTVKSLALKCNTTATTTTTASTYNWTIEIPGDTDDMIPTGVTSGSTITETYDDTSGQAITLTNGGSLTIALDASSPAIKLANANTSDVILSAYRFTANNEPVKVQQLGLTLAGTSSNTPQDLTKVTFWDGSTKVGEAIFSTDTATATLTADFTVPKDSDKTLTIKGDIAAIGTSLPARPGHLVRVEIDAAAGDTSGDATRGIGLSSGSTVYSSGTPSSSNGVRIVKAVPTLAKLSLPSTKLVNATIPLYRFSVTAPSHGGVGLYKFSYTISTSTQGVTTFAITGLQVRGYSDASFATAAYDNNGLLNSSSMVAGAQGGATTYDFYFDPVSQGGTAEAIQVPAGQTRYFELVGTVANMSATSSSVSVNLLGDAAYTAGTNNQNDDSADNFTGSSAGNYAFATTAANVDTDTSGTGEDFIWSDNATTTSGVATYDWFNGFQVPGLPSNNMTSEVLTP